MNYRIESDANSWNLCKRRVIKEGENAGKETWSPVAYCATLEQAALRMLEEITKDNVAASAAPEIRELIAAVRSATDEVKKAIEAARGL